MKVRVKKLRPTSAKPKVTYADKIRSMSDEELVGVVNCGYFEEWTCREGMSCNECTLAWLKKETDKGGIRLKYFDLIKGMSKEELAIAIMCPNEIDTEVPLPCTDSCLQCTVSFLDMKVVGKVDADAK